MPEKIKKSIKTKNKVTGKYETEHFYVKNRSIEELETLINNKNTRPKIKLKALRELIRRNKVGKQQK
jgi:hypothetical protein